MRDMGAPHASPEERFTRFVSPEPNSGCWLWTGNADPKGYGRFFWGRKRGADTMAHRASYRIHCGPIPEGKVVCHRCDNPSCVNPDHLWLGSVDDNNKDRERKGRGFAGRYGEAANPSKLTEEQVIAVLKSTKSNAELARDYGVSATCIWSIRRGRTWPHLRRFA